MKRTILTLFFALLLPIAASAQWYLFPGSSQKKERNRRKQQELALEEIKRVQDSLAAVELKAYQDSIAAEEAAAALANQFILDIPEEINVALLLPIKASTEKPSANFLEYYSGALMAVRDLGSKGIRINLNVYDTDELAVPVSDATLAGSDVIIGPVAANEIESTLSRCPEGKFIVSPLEPKATALAQYANVVQAPAPQETQIDEMIYWLKEELGWYDTIYLLSDTDSDIPGSNTDYLLKKLAESGLDYTKTDVTAFSELQCNGTMRFVIASESEPFLCSAVNSIGNLAAKGAPVVLYSTSKIRSLEGINAESIFRANTRLTSNYFIDYDNPSIKDFILTYRALFKAEPSSFAFHGYDTMHFFVNVCAKYGRNWNKKLPEYSERGLQADFVFAETEEPGAVNSAVRRIIYAPDLSATLLQ